MLELFWRALTLSLSDLLGLYLLGSAWALMIVVAEVLTP